MRRDREMTVMGSTVMKLIAVAAAAVVGTAGWVGVAGVGAGAAQTNASGGPTGMPQPGSGDRTLTGVACTSASQCWAVGSFVNKQSLNEILSWNGSAWSQVPAPNPSGNTAPQGLSAVTCTGMNDCWAVGYHERMSTDLNEALHWNGSQWSTVPTPNPGGSGPRSNNELNAVACLSSSRCWAVGGVVVNGLGRNEALFWNGSSWSALPVPNPGSGTEELNGVTCASSQACWAVGSYSGSKHGGRNLILEWNGSEWFNVPAPNPGRRSLHQLNSVTCTAPSNCWAVGQRRNANGATLNEAMEWNGTGWSSVPTPQPSGKPTNSSSSTELLDVTCANPNDCWAVGQYYSIKGGAFLNEALQWNGSEWLRVRTPTPRDHPSANLAGVACANPSDCWAVGAIVTVRAVYLNQALQWNGSRWSMVPSHGVIPGSQPPGDDEALWEMMCEDGGGEFSTSPGLWNCSAPFPGLNEKVYEFLSDTCTAAGGATVPATGGPGVPDVQCQNPNTSPAP